MSVSLNRATIPWIANNEIPDCSRIVGFKMGHAFQNKGFCYEKVSTGGYSITVHPTCARARLVFPLSFTPSSNYKKQAYLTKLLTQRL